MKSLSSNPRYSVEVDQINKDEWSDLLSQFKDANIYQTWSYGAVRWGEKNLSHLVFKKDNRIIGISQATIRKIPVVGAGIAYIPWGPIWHKKGEGENLEDFLYIIITIREKYALKRGLLVRIAPNEVRDENNSMRSFLEQTGFVWKSTDYRTLLIDLSVPLEELRKDCARRWRRALKTAENKSLEIIEGTDDDLYEILVKLYENMLARKKFKPGLDINEFREIQKDLPEFFKMKIMVCKFKEIPVSALLASMIGDKGIGLIGATGDAGLNLGAFQLLNWNMISWMKGSGGKVYDFGGYNPDRNPGTATFKDGLPGQDVCHIGVFEACKSSISSFVVNYAEKLRSDKEKIKFLTRKMLRWFKLMQD